MTKLETPFGYIDIKIDGKSIPYIAQKGRALETLCPNVLGRYQIDVLYKPDGKEHEISCTFSGCSAYKRTPESGEDLECQGSYNLEGYKLSIGVQCETGCDVKDSEKYDYDAGYLENGMQYYFLERTKTQNFTFGIAWIDNVGLVDSSDDGCSRDIETWFGADPTLAI